jgi:cell division GTPase FtsZ
LYSIGHDIEFIWGAIYDDNLEESLKITLIATGFKIDEIPSIGKITCSTTPIEEVINSVRESVVKEQPKVEVVEKEVIETIEEVEEKEPEEEIIDWDSWTADEDEDDEIPPSQRKK